MILHTRTVVVTCFVPNDVSIGPGLTNASQIAQPAAESDPYRARYVKQTFNKEAAIRVGAGAAIQHARNSPMSGRWCGLVSGKFGSLSAARREEYYQFGSQHTARRARLWSSGNVDLDRD